MQMRLLRAGNLAVEDLATLSCVLLEFTDTLSVVYGQILNASSCVRDYDVFNMLTEAVVVISRTSWVRGRSFAGYVSTEIDSESDWTNV